MKQEYIRVGRIVNAHGIRGEVRVQPRRVWPPPFSPAATPFILDGQPVKPPRRTMSTRSVVLLKLPGVDDMNAALDL